MANYIHAIEAFTTPAKLECAKLLIKKFTGSDGIGQKCHQYLMEKRDAEDNWVSLYYMISVILQINF